MKLFYKKRVAKTFALICLFSILSNVLVPTVSYALTSGPAQPEFSSFEPVATTNMVNEFSGDFTYNLPVLEVPGPNGSGYAMSLSYHSGVTSEEEASWVGYGWTLNPGAINRNTRGFPDEYNGNKVTYFNKVPDNWTVTVGTGVGLEAFSLDVSVNSALRYNNYKGFGYNLGFGVGAGKGLVSLGYNISDGEGTYSLNVNPASIASLMQEKSKEKNSLSDITEIKDVKTTYNRKSALKSAKSTNLFGSQYGIFSYSEMVRPTSVNKFTGASINASTGFNGTFTPLEIGLSANIHGSFTYQHTDSEKILNAYGYMNSHNVTSDDDIMDYYVEKETAYNKRDVFLGIPFNNADNFIVTGEGLGGGFRLFDKKIGQFRPNKVTSTTIIGNPPSIEVEAGLNYGGGSDLGGGFSTLKVGDWDENISTFKDLEGVDEKQFFRFNNDLGGSIEHANTGLWEVQARFAQNGDLPGSKEYKPVLNSQHLTYDLNSRVGRSSYISYSTNKQIYDATNGNKPLYNVHSVRNDLNVLAKRESYNSIGEIVTYNESGAKYIYGLPVYSKGEQNLQYGLKDVPESSYDINKYIVYGSNSDYMKVGEQRNDAYASSFLLTDIISPDYIDRTLDGPTEDDFGGYTRFNYEKHKGEGKGAWYKWKMPYNGYYYQRNSLSDGMDDMATVTRGHKEIYYLASIETKTHIAKFITVERTDGLDASVDETLRDAKGANKLKKLQSIELFSKQELLLNPSAKPIKTVKFSYTEDSPETMGETLCKGIPNGATSTTGKLTLKKVWFEYQGETGIKVSPYIFNYSYPNPSIYPEPYKSKLDFNVFTDPQQNPSYSPFSMDAWGNYQQNSLNSLSQSIRHINMQNWLDQSPDYFDPAAWHLKRIKLPTGGEIHVQYEQDDYCYVQNQKAHVMVGLTKVEGNRFYINTSEINVNSEAEKDALVKLINRMYEVKQYETKDKIYFKFLYQLLDRNGVPEIDNCNAEYIKGYTDVVKAAKDNGSVYIELFGDQNNSPAKVCRDFIKAERAGRIQMGKCNGANIAINPAANPIDIVKQFLRYEEAIKMPKNTCSKINPALSYFRVPTPLSKIGGGLRVKRLLMYDKSIEGALLFGNEYHYKTFDEATNTIRSSGVATNEPSSIREENILVKHIQRKHQTKPQRMVAGRDKKQSEGPLGETILPSPSVGYSKVFVTNIHTGETNPGFTVKEFYTAFTHPMSFRKSEIESKTDYLPLPLGLINKYVNNHWATQGFSFVLNDMHGQIKRVASYGGKVNYTSSNKADVIAELIALSSQASSNQQEYEYFRPGEAVPLVDGYGKKPELGHPGLEVDMTFAQSSVKDELYDLNLEFDVDVGYIPPAVLLFFISAFPSITANTAELYTHATSKVVRCPAIVKKVTSMQDGVKHITENLSFDKSTGKPVAVKSFDDYTGAYLSQDIPASWQYDNFKQKALNEGMQIAGVSVKAVDNDRFIEFKSGNSCQLLNNFSRGDLVAVANSFYHISGFDYAKDRMIVQRSQITSVDPNGDNLVLTILRSGRTNQLAVNVGNITTHSPLSTIDTEAYSDLEELIDSDFSTALTRVFRDLPPISNSVPSYNTTANLPGGPFFNMDISNFSSYIPPGCNVDVKNAKISNVQIWLHKTPQSIDFGISSFTLDCSGTPTVIGPQ